MIRVIHNNTVTVNTQELGITIYVDTTPPPRSFCLLVLPFPENKSDQGTNNPHISQDCCPAESLVAKCLIYHEIILLLPCWYPFHPGCSCCDILCSLELGGLYLLVSTYIVILNSCVLTVTVLLCITLIMYYIYIYIYRYIYCLFCFVVITCIYLLIFCVSVHFSVYTFVSVYFTCVWVRPHVYLCTCVFICLLPPLRMFDAIYCACINYNFHCSLLQFLPYIVVAFLSWVKFE